MCAVRVIAESESVQEFLTEGGGGGAGGGAPVDLKVVLPDARVLAVSVPRAAHADAVYAAAADALALSPRARAAFYLFEILEYNFGEYLLSTTVYRCLLLSGTICGIVI